MMCETGFASYADDNTPYDLGDNTDDVIKLLEDDCINLFKWFFDNQRKQICNKCHLINTKQSCINLKIRDINIESSTCEKVLRVKVDKKLNFSEHFDEIIKKTSCKVVKPYKNFPFVDLTKRLF